MAVDLKDIKSIIDLMRKNAVTEFELEKQDFKIRLKRGANGGGAAAAHEDTPLVAYAPPLAVPPPAPVPAAAPPPAASNELEIKSPMIGTFYRAPSPESAPYVEVGTEVGPETVVCIIEAMKVMNEIRAECVGKIVEVCVQNAQPVEYGQVLFRVRPS